ncbi:bifunctional methyltransferase/pyrophosphohydrolase YabN [Virgibacillus necropolis]|uniref:Nucleoside triphosphate pyrophosphohydrolase n=1 Tax=Virgibacillus necropolis TaxID=163877 RepID=A0A221M7W9_9BACI|nr:nucleoside triphosphate pyrophosphohydrolase [Virgibacillus necropolis]ASN03734.1 nucleoside triphosphate pyrophosphohydrolase [Virgibacillus necropolis]
MANRIEVIGLGAGDINQLPLGIYKKLTSHKQSVYTRTTDHPVIDSLKQEGVSFEAFDYYYENNNQFKDVYVKIVEELLEQARNSSIIYTIPGHPMLAEKTVQLLLEQNDISVEIVGGQSYLDDLFTTLKIDPIDGFQFVDGTSFNRNQLDYRSHLVFCQVYDAFIASNVKLALLEDLPPDYLIKVVEAAGSTSETITTIPLEDLDHALEVGNLTSVYVPPAPSGMLNHTFNRLREVISTLRGPGGCPWDQAQTHETLREYAIEEVYELIDAIDEQDDEGIIEELGDILLQVMLHSQIGEDNGYFMIDDVIQSITDKMIHRHPHVFSDTKADTVSEVYKTWETIKQEEKGHARPSYLDGVPKHFPSLSKASELQEKAAKVGFEWDNLEPVWQKLEEEIAEVKEAIDNKDDSEIEKEFGDVLFVIANLARYYKINAEVALNQTNQKFMSRFRYIEEKLADEGKQLADASLEEMDNYWNQAKRKE